MIIPPNAPDQERRLAALRALNLLDTEPASLWDLVAEADARMFEAKRAKKVPLE